MEAIRGAMARKPMPAELRPVLEDFLWEHPDVRPAHLAFFDGVRTVPDAQWKRSREWDNVLGYYDPATKRIMLHEHARKTPQALKANFAVALGESLLGRYVEERRWRDLSGECRIYEIRLRPESERECFFRRAPCGPT